MDVDAVAAFATSLKSAEVKSEVSMAVLKQAMDMFKAEGEMVALLMQKAMGIGQNVNIIV